MLIFVLIVATVIIATSVAMIIHPATVKSVISEILAKNWMWPTSIIRFVLGTLMIMEASRSNFPIVVYLVGYLMVAAAIFVPVMGKAKMDGLALNFIGMRDYLWRIFAFFGLLGGIGLALCGLP